MPCRSPCVIDPEAGHDETQQIVARELRRVDPHQRVGVAVELRPQPLHQHGLAGADLACNDNETFALRQAEGEMRDRAAMRPAAVEEAGVRCQQEG